jgi:hypothetical protein
MAPKRNLLLTFALLALALPGWRMAAAQSACTSDGLRQPVVLLERFINADCEACWSDAKTPAAGRNEIALDWVLPGGKGDDAPLATVARRDGLERLQALRRAVPEGGDSVRSRRSGAGGGRVRIAQGPAMNDYIGTSIELRRSTAPVRAWLVLVETLPAGMEGSPVARNLVRNVFQPDWQGPAKGPRKEARAMQIHEGAKPERLRLVAVLEDERGRLVGLTRTRCSEP